MKKGGTGGGNTITGLIYEGKVDLATFIAEQKNYAVEGNDVFFVVNVLRMFLRNTHFMIT